MFNQLLKPERADLAGATWFRRIITPLRSLSQPGNTVRPNHPGSQGSVGSLQQVNVAGRIGYVLTMKG